MNNQTIIEKFITVIDLCNNLNSIAQSADNGTDDAKELYNQAIDVIYSTFINDFSALDGNISAKIEPIYKKLIKKTENNMYSTNELNDYINVIKSYISTKAPVLLFDDSIKLNNDDFEIMMSFYINSEFPDLVKALGILTTALTQKSAQPDRCYLFALEAFKLYPKLAESFSLKYIYDESKINDTIYEACPICGCEDATPHYCAPQYMLNDNNFSPVKLWLKCSKCQNLYAYNFPVMKMGDINGHYTRNFSYDHIEPRYSLRVYSDIFNKCRTITQGREYLEIGIGGGEMLAAAMEMGYNVDAVEICREDCEKVSAVLGIDIKWCDFIQYNSDKKYDIIIMGDVLEHVSDPKTALKKAKSLLSENGVLWLSTPNYNSGFSRLMKFKDAMWNQKNHFTYFSYETLLPILHEIGLDVEIYDISNRFNGSMELYCVNKKS